MSNAKLSLAAIAASCGTAIGGMSVAEAKASSLREEANKQALALHKEKAKIGIYKKDGTGCAIATAFIDAGVAAGCSHSTMQKTYLPAFKQVVATGKPLSDWNLQRGKNKGKKGGNKSKGKAELSALFVKVFNHPEFAPLCKNIENGYEDAKYTSIHAGFIDYLKSEGYEISE
jgi:hypothetical protein